MKTSGQLGSLERVVMGELWDADRPLTVREVHEALLIGRPLAYTTVMTVLRRLSDKGLVAQIREQRAHRYAPARTRDELVAGLMVDALDQVTSRSDRHTALVHFVERVGPHEVQALRDALAEIGSASTVLESIRDAGSSSPSQRLRRPAC